MAKRELTFLGVRSEAWGMGYHLSQTPDGKYYLTGMVSLPPPYDRALTLKEVDDFLDAECRGRNDG